MKAYELIRQDIIDHEEREQKMQNEISKLQAEIQKHEKDQQDIRMTLCQETYALKKELDDTQV